MINEITHIVLVQNINKNDAWIEFRRDYLFLDWSDNCAVIVKSGVSYVKSRTQDNEQIVVLCGVKQDDSRLGFVQPQHLLVQVFVIIRAQ